MLIDNMLWDGAVADPNAHDPDTERSAPWPRKIAKDERVEMTLATIGDGLSMVVKR